MDGNVERPLFVMAAALAFVLTACTTASSKGPGVADIGPATTAQPASSPESSAARTLGQETPGSSNRSSGGASASAVAKADPTLLLVQWAACMRKSGDPNQPDPTIDSNGGINIAIPSSAQSMSDAVHNGTAPCNGYLVAASSALRAGARDLTPPNQASLVQYSQCMRANGIPNYPDPGTSGQMNFNGTGIDVNSPFFTRANDICGKKIHAPSWWISGAGPPGNISVQSGPMCGNTVCAPSGAERPRPGATTSTTGG
jgi:hypothetical protein